MAQVNYEAYMEYNKKAKSTATRSPATYVRYFGLKDNGDTAIVRFNIKSMDDPSLAVQSIHGVKTADGKFRTIGCLRSGPDEPFEHCPLCEDTERGPQLRIFIQLLDYQQDENGNTVAVPSIWSQPARMRETLKSFLMEYGDLTDYVFKITRQGARGDQQVKYTIIPCNQNIYKEDVFKKDFTAFETYDLSSCVLDLSYEEMQQFVATDRLPTPAQKSTSNNAAEPVKTAENISPVAPTNPLRSAQPIRATYTENSNTTASATPGPRRYTY